MRTRIACFESENRSDSLRLTASHGKRASRPEREYRLEVRRDERESSPAGRSAQRPSDQPTDRMKESTPRAAPPNQRLPIFQLLFLLGFPLPSFLLIFWFFFQRRPFVERRLACTIRCIPRFHMNPRSNALLTDVRRNRNPRLNAEPRKDGTVRASFQAWQIGWKFRMCCGRVGPAKRRGCVLKDRA